MVIAGEMTGGVPDAVRDGQEADRRKNRRDARPGFRGLVVEGGGMARFGDLEAAIMDVIWAAGAPVRVREVRDRLNQDRALAFNTVQTVMENLYRKGWLGRRKDGRAYWYESVRSRDDYADGLLAEALSAAREPAGRSCRQPERGGCRARHGRCGLPARVSRRGWPGRCRWQGPGPGPD